MHLGLTVCKIKPPKQKGVLQSFGGSSSDRYLSQSKISICFYLDAFSSYPSHHRFVYQYLLEYHLGMDQD